MPWRSRCGSVRPGHVAPNGMNARPRGRATTAPSCCRCSAPRGRRRWLRSRRSRRCAGCRRGRRLARLVELGEHDHADDQPRCRQNSSIRHGTRAGPSWLGWTVRGRSERGRRHPSRRRTRRGSRVPATRRTEARPSRVLRRVASYTARRPDRCSTRYASLMLGHRDRVRTARAGLPADRDVLRGRVAGTPRGSRAASPPADTPRRGAIGWPGIGTRSPRRGYCRPRRRRVLSSPLRRRRGRAAPRPCDSDGRSRSPAPRAAAWPSPGCCRRAG